MARVYHLSKVHNILYLLKEAFLSHLSFLSPDHYLSKDDVIVVLIRLKDPQLLRH